MVYNPLNRSDFYRSTSFGTHIIIIIIMLWNEVTSPFSFIFFPI